jgi:MFS superfamily sulfate permease-like transporter
MFGFTCKPAVADDENNGSAITGARSRWTEGEAMATERNGEGLFGLKISSGFWRDALAGLSLASMNIPQVLGYARIAGMPAVTGLYTVLLPLLAFAALGASRHLVVAADSATAAIFSGALSEMAPVGSGAYISMVSAVALLNAGFLLVARLCRLGFLADFLSRTVLVGFLAGVGVQVGLGMLYDMLGLVSDRHTPVLQALELERGIPRANGVAALISCIACLILLLGQKYMPRKPVALAVIGLGMLLGWSGLPAAHGVRLLGAVQGGVPVLHVPVVPWENILALLPVSASCVFVIIAQSAATSRAFADMFHETVDENRDILGLSAANAVAGLSGTFTVNGSPTQTAMAVRVGAMTQRAQVVFAGVTLCVLLTLTGPLAWLPHCVLASVVFCVAIGMVDLSALNHIRRESPGEFWLALVTAATVVGVGVEQGIFIAIALSLFRHVRHSYRPHTMVLRSDAATGAMEVEPVHVGAQTEPGLIVYRFSADLFYANCQLFAQDITLLVETAPVPVRCLVVDCSAVTDIDYSAACVVRDVFERLSERQVQVFLGRVLPYALADMERHHIVGAVRRENIFEQLHAAVAAARAFIAD